MEIDLNEPVHLTEPTAGAGFIWLMALACGVTVANLYYNQPLLAEMARSFDASPRGIGAVPMLTQIGYAAGMLLIVPLGDVVQRKRLVFVLLLAVAVALAFAAVSRSLVQLTVASLLIGVTTVVPQVLTPLAAQLVAPERRGKALGVVLMGLLLGVLLSRTVSGVVGHHLGWRAMYWIAAGMMVALAFILGPLIPRHDVHADLTYPQLLASVAKLVHCEPVLRQSMTIGGLAFAMFSAFWVTLVFRLETPPLHYGAQMAGLFGLVGAAGALASPVVGHFADRVPPRSIITIMLGVTLIGFGILWIGGTTLTGIAIGVVLLDLAVQSTLVANLARVYALNEKAHSRMNSAFMVAYFVGGALGSVAGAYAWSIARWNGVCALGVLLAIIALILHVVARSEPEPNPS